MKKISFIIVMMLCAITMNVKAINGGDSKVKQAATTCSCCKNCKDDKCKELCAKYCAMTPEAQKSDDGKKVKADCMKICEAKKCCTSADGKTATACTDMEGGKSCCKKK